MVMQTLLGHLAQFGSFSMQGEVLCTQGLAYLLQDSDARLALAEAIQTLTGVKISDHLTWRAEVHQDDKGRPDLEACTAEGIPTVKIEAKLGAALSPDQFRSYVTDLQNRSPEGVLLVLVPQSRTGEAAKAVTTAFGLTGSGPWRPAEYPGVAIRVVSWEDILVALGRAESDRFRHELEQFGAMYRVVNGCNIEPLAGAEELVAWRERETDFTNLVDRVTRLLTTHHRVYPMAVEALEQDPEGLESKGYNRRYVCYPNGASSSCFSIGVRDPFAGSQTPFWLRFHHKTPNFPVIRDRLGSSDLAPKLVKSGNDIWIPLDVPFRTGGEEMVDALVKQAKEVIRVAYHPMP
jgi:hypothetical protein